MMNSPSGPVRPQGHRRPLPLVNPPAADALCTLQDRTQRYERLIRTIPCAVYDYVRWSDGRSRFYYISPQAEDIFGLSPASIMADASLLWGLVHPDDLARLQEEDRTARANRVAFQSEVRIMQPTGPTRWIQLNSRCGPHQVEGEDLWSGVIHDITERKQLEAERDRLVTELQTALAEVQTLSGFLPICACCKKIRDDRGYWNQLEVYLSEHSHLEFSHGICPDCTKTYYGELDEWSKAAGKTGPTPA